MSYSTLCSKTGIHFPVISEFSTEHKHLEITVTQFAAISICSISFCRLDKHIYSRMMEAVFRQTQNLKSTP